MDKFEKHLKLGFVRRDSFIFDRNVEIVSNEDFLKFRGT